MSHRHSNKTSSCCMSYIPLPYTHNHLFTHSSLLSLPCVCEQSALLVTEWVILFSLNARIINSLKCEKILQEIPNSDPLSTLSVSSNQFHCWWHTAGNKWPTTLITDMSIGSRSSSPTLTPWNNSMMHELEFTSQNICFTVYFTVQVGMFS